MKKTITILSIIAIVLSALSLFLAAALLFVFWEQVCVLFYQLPKEVIAAGPILPIGDTVNMVGCTVLIVVAFICSKSSKTIVGEILSIVLLSIVLPLAASYLSIAQTTKIVSGLGASAFSALNIATNISGFARSLMSLAATLCFVVCGMSIAEKINTKKSNIYDTEFIG